MPTVTSYTKDAIDDSLNVVRSAVQSTQFGTSPSKTASQNTAAIQLAITTANTFGIAVQIDQDIPVNSINLTSENVRIVGSGKLIQQIGQNVINIQRPWGNIIPCNAPTLMQFGSTGIQGSGNISVITLPSGGYNQFENGDAFNISSNDTYSWNAASGGSDVYSHVKAGMLSILGVGLTVNAIANGGPIEGLILKGATSNATGTVQSVLSQGATVSNIIFNKVSADFSPGENLIVQTGGSSALASGTLVGTAGSMYIVKAGIPFVDTYPTTPNLRKLDRNIATVLDIKVMAVGWDSYVAASQRRDAVIIAGAYDIDVKVNVSGTWSRALSIISCYRGRYSSVVDGAPNHTGDDQGGFGYGVSLMGSTELLDGYVNARNVRHGHTTNVNYTAVWSADGKRTLSSGAIVDVYREWGAQKYCKVTGVGMDCTNSVWDTHPGAMFFEFINCTAFRHSGQGRTGSTSKNLFSHRGIGTRYYNCHADGGGFSDGGAGADTGYKYQTVYKGCTSRNAQQYGFNQLFPAASDGAGGFWQELIIEGCNFHMDGTILPYAAQRPILLSTCDAKIRDTTVSNFNDTPVSIVSTNSNGTYRFTNFTADYSKGVGRKPFQISGTVELNVDYKVEAATGLLYLFETVSGGTNIGVLDIDRLGSLNLPPMLLNTSGSGQITYRGLRPIRRFSSVGDASITVALSASGSILKFDTPLTATRVVTLPTDGSATNGDMIDVLRTISATNVSGTRYVNVVANGITLAVLDIGQLGEFRYDGTNWFLYRPLMPFLGTLEYNALVVGTETLPRNNVNSNIAMTSGTARFAYFTARKSEGTTRARVCSGTTGATATPSLVKYALYSVDPTTGDLTRIAITANDTSTFASASQVYTKNWLATAGVIAGNRYAFAVLVISAVAVPTVAGNIPVLPSSEMGATDPILSKAATGQTDLAASYTAASLTDSNNMVYGVVRT